MAETASKFKGKQVEVMRWCRRNPELISCRPWVSQLQFETRPQDNTAPPFPRERLLERSDVGAQPVGIVRDGG